MCVCVCVCVCVNYIPDQPVRKKATTCPHLRVRDARVWLNMDRKRLGTDRQTADRRRVYIIVLLLHTRCCNPLVHYKL